MEVYIDMRTGRCRHCEKFADHRRAIIYRWKPGRRRLLLQARCRVCGESLAQTNFKQLKNPVLRDGDPAFISGAAACPARFTFPPSTAP